jgi:arylsulfatase A-like enzyme
VRPGRDLSPLLRGDETDWDEVHVYEFENARAIRTPQWKYIERIHQMPNELYDLVADPDEHNNLYGQAEHEQALLALRRRLHEFFDKHADPQWDLWHGGKSKTEIYTEKFFGITNPYAPSNWSPSSPPRAVKAP